MKKVILCFSLITACYPLPASSHDVKCYKRSQLVKAMEEAFGLKSYGVGPLTPYIYAEIWGNHEEGSAAVIVTDENGISCLAFTMLPTKEEL